MPLPEGADDKDRLTLRQAAGNSVQRADIDLVQSAILGDVFKTGGNRPVLRGCGRRSKGTLFHIATHAG